MITEIVQVDIKPGQEKDFEAAVGMARSIFQRSKGWKSLRLLRTVERPSHYRVLIEWETLESHTVDFREGPNFAEWRALVGSHFASPPHVEHMTSVSSF